MLASINGTELHYELHGSGPPLLLIHGLGSSGADWAFQVPALREHYKVILADLRGSGLSGKPDGPYSIEGFADDLWQLLSHLHIEHCHLVGFSLGGAVAMEMALQQPKRAQRLVTINALPSYRIDHWRKWLEAHMQIAMVRLLGLHRTAGMVARRLFPHPHQIHMRRRVVEVVGANGVDPYLHSVRALMRWCAESRLHALQAPTLLLAAEHDYTPLAEKQAWAERLRAQLAVVAGSRHGTPFDSIDATNRCLLAFLSAAALPEQLRLDDPEFAPASAPD